MRKWEYKSIPLGDDYDKEMSKLGDQGWEAYGITVQLMALPDPKAPDGKCSSVYFAWFKREKFQHRN